MLKNHLSIFTLILLLSGALFGQIRTDLQDANLKGRVKSVKTELAEVQQLQGRSVEGPRRPKEMITFDERGRITERIDWPDATAQRYSYTYLPDGRIESRTDMATGDKQSFSYNGQSMVKTNLLEDGHILDKLEIALDKNGRITREDYFLVDRNLGERLVSPPEVVQHKYDVDGHLLETSYFDFKGSPVAVFGVHKYVMTYDEKGRRRDQTSTKIDGSVVYKWVYDYNDKGDLVEVTRFFQFAQLFLKVKYSDFDSNGNWTKSSMFRISVIDGKEVATPGDNQYRTITYF